MRMFSIIFQLSIILNEEISGLIEGLDNITYYQNETHLASTAMMWMQPYTKNLNFFHYSGSLTTAPCTEVVTWVLLKNHSTIAPEQVYKIKK